MKKIVLALTLFTSLTFLSCSSDDNKSESTGISTGNYWPMAVNNTWNFFGNGINSEIKIVGTAVFDGKTYFEIKDNSYTNSDIKGYMINEGATYFQRVGETTVNENGVVITIQGYEIPIFKDNFEENESWSGTVNQKASYVLNGKTTNLNGKLNYKGTILTTNATETINDVTYTDVIKMSMVVKITFQNQTTEASVEYWFAKDVGPIKTIEVGGAFNINRDLVNLNVN